jgi:hypothetical protein
VLRQLRIIDRDGLSDLLEQADGALAYAVEALLGLRGWAACYLLVIPMRCRGVVLELKEWGKFRPFKGDVLVACKERPELRRNSKIADLRVGMPLDPSPLPRLLDAELVDMARRGFVLRGIEYMEGCAYAQS